MNTEFTKDFIYEFLFQSPDSRKEYPMGLFAKILSKLGIKKDEPVSAPANVAAAPKPAAPKPVAPAAKPAVVPTPKPAAPASVAPKVPSMPAKDIALERIPNAKVPAAPAPISEVDVVTKLEGLAAANPAKLNWKVSIVDLLKLLDLESSFEARKELAVELGCPAELMNDSAKMNTWLHKTVLKEIAQNGGNIPKELLD